MDCLSSTQPAQSASEKALTIIDFDLLIFSPIPHVPRTYLNILLTELQWIVVGACRNWHTLFTAKERSGRVRVRYCRAPTILWYLVESFGPSLSPPSMLIFSKVERGVSIDLQFFILALVIISIAYLYCESIKPSSNRLTSMPKK
jgi:hypothetical protein